MKKASKLRVGVIFGGRSGEHEVSLMSARSILNALNPEKYNVTQIGITHDGVWLVGEDVLNSLANNRLDHLMPATLIPNPAERGLFRIRRTAHGDTLENLIPLDVIFPVLHGSFGEDGTLQGLLEMDDLAYVGAGVLASSLGMDKGVFRDVMTAHEIPVVETLSVLRKDIEQDIQSVIARIEEFFSSRPYPLFVKPANLGSSVGITKCRSRSDLMEGLLEAARYDRRVLIERGVNAREIEISVIGNDNPEVSVPGEVIPSREFYSYEAKYIDDASSFSIPAPLPAEMTRRVQELALRAYKAIDCAGMARVDFLLDKDSGELFLSEVNTIPGFTDISMFPKLWEASGLSYPALVDRLIDLALERKAERDRTERRYGVPPSGSNQ
jgi:D-alanine-D-alanine ligase